jgi:hypothetical protein
VSDDSGFRDFDPHLTPWRYVSAVIEYARGNPKSFRALVKQIRAATKRPRGHPVAMLPSAARQVADEARKLARENKVTIEQAVYYLAYYRAFAGLLPVPKMLDGMSEAEIAKAAEETEAVIDDFAQKVIVEARRPKRRSSK